MFVCIAGQCLDRRMPHVMVKLNVNGNTVEVNADGDMPLLWVRRPGDVLRSLGASLRYTTVGRSVSGRRNNAAESHERALESAVGLSTITGNCSSLWDKAAQRIAHLRLP